MTTFVVKRDVVWLESEVGEQCDKIVLLGEDGGQTEVPALLLLAASPVVRIILSESLPSFHSPVVTFQGATEDTLKVVGDILSTGIAAGIMEKSLGKVEDVFDML